MLDYVRVRDNWRFRDTQIMLDSEITGKTEIVRLS